MGGIRDDPGPVASFEAEPHLSIAGLIGGLNIGCTGVREVDVFLEGDAKDEVTLGRPITGMTCGRVDMFLEDEDDNEVILGGRITGIGQGRDEDNDSDNRIFLEGDC